ncbi:MAG: DUF2938 domain-containing protein [bacterium]|nr:DUF2938 domain-containing protein [bacterium]
MIFPVEAILMGLLATVFMDLLAVRLAKMNVIHPPIGPEAVGRWTLYMFRGKFIHKDIHKTPALSNEKSAALLSHYLIGIVLAGVYLLLELKAPTIRNQLWMPLIFGLATVLLPWLWLYPSMGLGFLASKAPRRSPYIVTSLVNHTNFGLGLCLWIVLFRRFLV